ncbi:MAG: GDP-mannose 4,6-dehydratase [Candidatus Paceibacterota bacterium]
MSKCLITGAAGFIGLHLTESLLQSGKEVVAIGIANKGFVPDKKIKFYETTVGDPIVSEIFKKEKPEIVYHLSGPIYLRRAIDDPFFELSANFFTDIRKLLYYSRDCGVKKIIYTSSGGALYGPDSPIPTSEKTRVCPDSFYGIANLMIEKMIESYCENFKFFFAILRLSNAYGPRQWKEGIIPSIVSSIIANKPVNISGDGEQTRDFVYVGDVVKALGCASEIKTNGIINVGYGQEITLNLLCEKISKILGKNANIVYQKDKPSGVRRSAVDISKIKKELGWEPVISLEQGLRETIDWFKLKEK